MVKDKLIIGGVAVGLLAVLIIATKASGGGCYTVDNIGIGSTEDYHYATYTGATMPILEAFGDTNNDIFTVEFLIGGLYQPVTAQTVIPEGQQFRFQVVRTTEICNIKLEGN